MDGLDAGPATDNSIGRSRAMIDTADSRIHRWLSVGIALIWVVATVVLVVKDAYTWGSVVALLMAMVALAYVAGRHARSALALVTAPERASGSAMGLSERRTPLWLLLPAMAVVLATADTANRLGLLGSTNMDIARFWIASMALLLLAAWWHALVSFVRIPIARRWRALSRPSVRTVALWLAMIAIAAVPRLVALNRYPTVFGGDEGQYMLIARASRDGTMSNPFGPGFSSNPNLYSVAAGWVSGFLGTDAAAYRTFSAILGTIGVIAVWRLGRYLTGHTPAVIGAVILATMPFHLHFSRTALNNVSDPTVIALALLFLVRTVRRGHRGDAVVCGMILGFGFYGYFGGRAFPVIVLLSLVILAIGRRVRAVDALRFGAWMMVGFFAVATPLIVAFWKIPSEFNSRVSTVSAFSRDRLLSDPTDAISVYLELFREAMLFPLLGNQHVFFRHEAPFLGWPVAILLPVGVAVWIVRVARDRDIWIIACLVLPWVALAGGVALTTPVQSQRLMAVTPFIALAAGSGLFLVARWLAMMFRPARISISSVAIAMVLVIVSVGNLRWASSEDRQISTYTDYRTTLAWDVGWRVSHGGGGEVSTLLFAGPPIMFGNDWGNLRFQAPDLNIADVTDPIEVAGLAPALPRDAVLVIIAERASERCDAERIYGDATMAEAHSRDGTLLYVAMYYGPLEGWSSARSPAGTTFVETASSPCDLEQAGRS